MMKTSNFFKISALTAFAALITLGCLSAIRQNAQTMSNQSKPNQNRNTNSAQPGNGQIIPGAVNSNASATSGGLAKYKDIKIDSLPSKAVSPKYIVEHRTALNDKIITVSGVIVSVNQPATDNSAAGGVRSMANPQPRIFIADNAKNSRDKNRDMMVIVEEGNNYSVGQKVTLKVKVSSSKVAVMLQKIS
jgi:hypothetical protein